MKGFVTAIILFCQVMAMESSILVAQTSGRFPSLLPGQVSAEVKTRQDAKIRYALYLPSTYTRGETYPVLFLMDPRGRAMHAMQLFQSAAERHSFVVLSSYDTESDSETAFEVNARVLNALLTDAQVRFGADPQRFYLAGFSGTAHYAWLTAPQLDGHLAGIIGVGGGLPVSTPPVQAVLRMRRPLAFFGIAGTNDFNYDEMRQLDRNLDTTRIAHRFQVFEGVHSWPPESLAETAIDWLQLQAMRTGLAEPDSAWMASLCNEYTAQASALETGGQLLDAMRRYREIANDCEGRPEALTARQQHAKLSKDKTVRKMQEYRDRMARRFYDFKREQHKFLRTYRSQEKPPEHTKAARRLKIASLRQENQDSSDPVRADAAGRMLADAFANLAFYEPRDYFATENYAKAAGMLRLALEIRPETPRVCYMLARAEAGLGHHQEAMAALRCAVNGNAVTAKTLHDDKLLKPLHGDADFLKLLAQLEAREAQAE